MPDASPQRVPPDALTPRAAQGSPPGTPPPGLPPPTGARSLENLRSPGLRAIAEDMLEAALNAVEPSRLVVRAFQALPSAIKDALRVRRGRLVVIGAGKAAGAMAGALEDALADLKPQKGVKPPPPVEGLVVLKRGAPLPKLRRIRAVEAAHPVPDEAGAAAARDMLELVAGLSEQDLVFALLSGGGSALLAAPAPGISLEDLQATTDLLLKAGAPIHELNAVRKHLSLLGGGRLAARSGAAALIAFVISDVPGDRLDAIASGPTVADETTYAGAIAALERRGLLDAIPAAARRRLEEGRRGDEPETLKPGDRALERTRTIVVGSNRMALEAAAERARERGYAPVILPGALSGDARACGATLARRLLAARLRAPAALIAGGETTVAVKGPGKGGRSQELALGAAQMLAGERGTLILAAGTDGEDGPTDAAGGVVDGATIADARSLGLYAEPYFQRSDVYHFLERSGNLLKTGRTGTNVMDVAFGLVSR